MTDDPTEFIESIIDILNHPNKYLHIKENARLLAEKYQWDKILSNYLEIIQQIN